jgi:hypothetical protein
LVFPTTIQPRILDRGIQENQWQKQVGKRQEKYMWVGDWRAWRVLGIQSLLLAGTRVELADPKSGKKLRYKKLPSLKIQETTQPKTNTNPAVFGWQLCWVETWHRKPLFSASVFPLDSLFK